MSAKSQQTQAFGFQPLFETLLFWRKPRIQTNVEEIHSQKKFSLTPEKKAELEKLCDQLFQRKKLVTSGKFQFIGLAQIKKRMGKRWGGLCNVVYDTAEAAIADHIGENDIFIRYRDDTYVIIFADATLEEGQIITAAIAEDIQRRLFEFENDDLKDMEIRKIIREIRTDFLIRQGFPDFLDTLAVGFEDMPFEDSRKEENEQGPRIKPVEVSAENYRKGLRRYDEIILPENITFTYLPLWDVARGALTTYLCLPRAVRSEDSLLEAHRKFYQPLSEVQRVGLDIQTLQFVMAELELMEQDGRKLLLACPVHYETLYQFENYEIYKQSLEKIPAGQRQFLVLVIFNMLEGLPTKNPYWFAAPLRGFCRHVFAEAPLWQDINFSYLRNTGVDGVGVRLEAMGGPEHEVINHLNEFLAKTKAVKIPRSFILGVSSLKLSTSALSAGFSFLGGPAIHEGLGKPDAVHRFRHQDLLAAMASRKAGE